MRYHKQSERPRFLRLVDGNGNQSTAYLTASVDERQEASPAGAEEAQPAEEQAESHDANTIISNAVMHAAMSWVSCCQEKAGVSVGVCALGGGLFDAEVTTADGRSTFLRVRLILERGPRLSTMVEPIHP
jgi:hypothetical protein